MSTLRVFTPRSTGIAVASGVLVAGVFGQLVGAAWGLAILNGLAVGALALAHSICWRDGSTAFLLEEAARRSRGVWMLALAIIGGPMLFVSPAVDIDIGIALLNPGDQRALSWLFGFTGGAAYALGVTMVTLAYLDDDEAAADPHLHRVATPPTPLRVFTARSTGIGIAIGALVIALGHLLGATRGLAALNGLVAGVLAVALSTGLRDGLLDTTDNHRRRPGIWTLTYAVMMAPTVFAHHYVELRPANEFGLAVLFTLTGFSGYVLGSVMAATLSHLGGNDSTADPRLHRFTLPPGDRGGL